MRKLLDVIVTAFSFWSLIGIIFLAGAALQSTQEEDVIIAKKHTEKVVARNIEN